MRVTVRVTTLIMVLLGIIWPTPKKSEVDRSAKFLEDKHQHGNDSMYI
jgi:hypothetical protein